LGRTPDPTGLAGWAHALQTGTSRVAIAGTFINSREVSGRLVQDAYQSVLQRNADTAGLAQWMATLNSGMPVDQIVAAIPGSAEFIQQQQAMNFAVDRSNAGGGSAGTGGQGTRPNGGFVGSQTLLKLVQDFEQSSGPTGMPPDSFFQAQSKLLVFDGQHRVLV